MPAKGVPAVRGDSVPLPASALERGTAKQTDPGATARQVMESRSGSAKKKKVMAKLEAEQSGEFEALTDEDLDRWLDGLPRLGNGNGNGDNHPS
jgi:hypothetical protein